MRLVGFIMRIFHDARSRELQIFHDERSRELQINKEHLSPYIRDNTSVSVDTNSCISVTIQYYEIRVHLNIFFLTTTDTVTS